MFPNKSYINALIITLEIYFHSSRENTVSREKQIQKSYLSTWVPFLHQKPLSTNHSTIFNKSDSFVTRILLYGNESFKDEVNLLILNATIDFVLSTNRFDEPLYLL